MEGKSKRSDFSAMEEGGQGGQKNNFQWLEWLMLREASLYDGDNKLTPLWRRSMANLFYGAPFSMLVTAVQKVFGEQIMQKSPPQLEQEGIAGGSDFLDKSIEKFQDLNLDVIEEVLRRLPLPTLMRARSVCKGWNKAITTPAFKEENNEYHFVMQDMMAEGFQGIAFFNSSLNHWSRIALPLPAAHLNDNLYLCAAAAGFLLFLNWDDRVQRKPFIMINPVSMQRKELPPLPDYYKCTIGTAVELIAHESGHFDIIALGLHSEWYNYCILLYNSTTNKWTAVPAMLFVHQGITHHTRFADGQAWSSAVNNGVVYFTREYGGHLGCYDIASMNFHFKLIGGGSPPLFIDYNDHRNNQHASLPSLVACNGKVFLVGRIEKGVRSPIYWGRFPFIEHTLLGIWELLTNDDHNKWCWWPISFTPQDLLEDTVASSHGTDFMVGAHSDKIWLTIRGSRNLLSLGLRCLKWSVLPACPVEDIADTLTRNAVCGTLSIS